jgi:hypothetical protein
MHKVLLTHQIVPGKFSELSDWFKEADAKRKADDQDYKPPRRYIYQTGSVFKVVSEFEFEKLVIDDATPFSQGGYPNYGETSQPDFFPFIVPGTSTMDILKEIK